MNFLNKFGLKFQLHSLKKIKISNVEFTTINPNDVLVNATRFKQKKTTDLTRSAYQSSLSF